MKAIYIPYECMLHAQHIISFEGRVRALIRIEGYKEIILYPINKMMTTRQAMEYAADQRVNDPEIRSHLRFVINKPLQETRYKTILTYGDFGAIHSIGKGSGE